MNTELIVDFVNSLELTPFREELESPRALGDWLTTRGLLPEGARVTRSELAEATRTREAIRDLLAANNEVAVDVEAATAELDAAARRAGLGVGFSNGAAVVAPAAGGVRGAVGRILAEISAGMADGTWERMKACRAEDCKWAYLDTAKNRSRAWCSMRSCGNRAKVQAYRERHQH